jgi:hypothetical protein
MASDRVVNLDLLRSSRAGSIYRRDDALAWGARGFAVMLQCQRVFEAPARQHLTEARPLAFL